MCAGNEDMQIVIDDCYTYNISTTELIRKGNMNKPRTCHVLQRKAQKIYAFGGAHGGCLEELKSAEVYDSLQNSWKNLPDMPKVGRDVTCVKVQNQILISSKNFRLISYDIDSESY